VDIDSVYDVHNVILHAIYTAKIQKVQGTRYVSRHSIICTCVMIDIIALHIAYSASRATYITIERYKHYTANALHCIRAAEYSINKECRYQLYVARL